MKKSELRQMIKEELHLLTEKLSYTAYLKDLGYSPAKFKKLDPHAYGWYMKQYKNSSDENEFEQNFLDDLIRNTRKIKLENTITEGQTDRVVKSEKDFNRFGSYSGPNAYHNYYYTVDGLLRKRNENPKLFKYVMKQYKYGDSDKDVETYAAKSGSNQTNWFREWDKVLKNIKAGYYTLQENNK